ncbi:hypothetical protein Tco_0222018 [Tanacetum coccineum]
MCSTSSDRIATITDKLDNLGRDMKKLKKNIHAIQVGCENCVGMHLDKELRRRFFCSNYIVQEIKKVIGEVKKDVVFHKLPLDERSNHLHDSRIIMEYLVKISKKARILELKRRYLKITVMTTNTPYPSRKIRRICACTSQKTMKETRSIRCIQERPIRRIQAMEIKYSRRYRTWSLLQEIPNTPKLLKTLSLDESRSLEFNLFFDIEEYSEKEVAETMAETMEQYMRKTRADYGSGIARPKINDKDSFDLKGQFLKELRDNTFSGSDHEDANEHIEKVLEVVDLFHIPNITQDQVMLRAFPMTLTRAASRWLRNKPSGSITNWEDLKTKFLSKYCPPARTAKKMEEIYNFQQEPDETLYQAWERDAVVVRDFYKKFYNSLGRVPNRCSSSSIGKTRGLLSFSRGIDWEGLITV